MGAPPRAASTWICRCPKALAGKKGATNPEELFAAGYASCVDMVRQAHKICPYSVGTGGNMEIELRVMGKVITVQAEENAAVAEGK